MHNELDGEPSSPLEPTSPKGQRVGRNDTYVDVGADGASSSEPSRPASQGDILAEHATGTNGHGPGAPQRPISTHTAAFVPLGYAKHLRAPIDKLHGLFVVGGVCFVERASAKGHATGGFPASQRLSTRRELFYLLQKYSRDGQAIPDDGLRLFLELEQHVRSPWAGLGCFAASCRSHVSRTSPCPAARQVFGGSKQEAAQLIEKYEPIPALRKEVRASSRNRLGRFSFVSWRMSPRPVLCPCCRRVTLKKRLGLDGLARLLREEFPIMAPPSQVRSHPAIRCERGGGEKKGLRIPAAAFA
jgi:hypothetical protein